MEGSNMAELTYDIARQLLKYEPDTGKLFWLERPNEFFKLPRDAKSWNMRYALTEALTAVDTRGYRHGNILSKLYRAHRVAWLITTGLWPDDKLDHLNGVRDDNRWENLREVSGAENNRNTVRQCSNTSGVNGVSWFKPTQKWRAYITVDGRPKHLGFFSDVEEAGAARAAANIKYGYSARHGA
jgi:hypothetical protein